MNNDNNNKNMTNNKCPLCGKETNDDESFCRNCQEIAHDAYSDELLAHSEPKEKALTSSVTTNIEKSENSEDGDLPTTKIPKSNKGLIIFICVGLALMLLIGGISYMFLQNKNAEETEIAYWNRCIEENSPLGYSKYLVQYPEGKFSEEAHSKIIEIRDNERKEWHKLRSSSNIDALFVFLKDHPDTPYNREIRHVIDSLNWLLTIKENTADAYKAYLDNIELKHYEGEYEPQAQERYNYLTQLKTLEGEELDEMKKIFVHFYKSLSLTDSKGIQKFTTQTLLNFYNSKNQDNKAIADSIKLSIKKKKIRNISYTVLTDSIEVILDNKGIYFVTLPVKTEITFIDKKKKKEHFENIMSIELNSDRLIRKIHNKEN